MLWISLQFEFYLNLSQNVLCILGQNPCAENNGGCSHLCLLSAVAADGFTCNCPDDLDLEENGKNCSGTYSNTVIFFDTEVNLIVEASGHCYLSWQLHINFRWFHNNYTVIQSGWHTPTHAKFTQTLPPGIGQNKHLVTKIFCTRWCCVLIFHVCIVIISPM